MRTEEEDELGGEGELHEKLQTTKYMMCKKAPAGGENETPGRRHIDAHAMACKGVELSGFHTGLRARDDQGPHILQCSAR